MLRALETVSVYDKLRIYSDSKYSISCVTDWYQAWQANNWRTRTEGPVKNKDLVQAVRAKIDERDLHGTPDQVNSSRDHLCQREQVERSSIELEMAPLVVGGNRLAESGVVLSVQGIERVLCVLESLNLCRLAHHRREQPAHQPDHCVFEFAAPTIIGRMAPIRERQTPYGICYDAEYS